MSRFNIDHSSLNLVKSKTAVLSTAMRCFSKTERQLRQHQAFKLLQQNNVVYLVLHLEEAV